MWMFSRPTCRNVNDALYRKEITPSYNSSQLCSRADDMRDHIVHTQCSEQCRIDAFVCMSIHYSIYMSVTDPTSSVRRPGGDVTFTRQTATHDRLELSYLVG